MLEWRRRREPSTAMLYLSPLIAIALTMLMGTIVFTAMGYDGLTAVYDFFLLPLLEPQRWPDLGVKAAPLVMIALGLAIGFRANVWNIGAEGQYIMGAIAGTGVALATYEMSGWWILPAMALAGILGGMAWAAIPALLRTRLQVSEILTSLMLTYVAIQALYYLVRGPWKDPDGFNFPQTRMFTPDQTLPIVIPESLVHLGIPAALLIALVTWLVLEKTTAGFAVKVVGLAPAAARHGGFSAERTTWITMLIGGGLAGLAGIFEAAGPFGQLTPQFPVGYGFTAIIVAFLGRLHPLGIVFGGIVLAATYVGGEIAQTTVRLPQAATGMFQALLLFFLLATNVLITYRIGLKAKPAKVAP
ncbi:ABC transporter permease [Bosea sp. BK604]|uniref:ABC transporter permease n=1 Tax=Bosea sp. BK604 TaxID=2512180 RepID=UPI0010489A9B|nr:ABC transporter permease [Bosea sp. BK604]TCR64963.1 nucleoside ABC transporter membrane protein [Bosea sp. BK604]